MAMLRQWQADRLAKTYADLLDHQQYGPACRFFLSDIYAPRDFSQRDYDIERVHTLLARFLPSYAYRHLTDSIEMNRLTYALDNALLDVLIKEMGVTDQLTPEQYVKAYRQCDNYAERLRQIEITVQIIREVGDAARYLVVGVALSVSRKPATAAGWGELHGFLERGYNAFRRIKKIDVFADTIGQREKTLLDRIYAGEEHPFDNLSPTLSP